MEAWTDRLGSAAAPLLLPSELRRLEPLSPRIAVALARPAFLGTHQEDRQSNLQQQQGSFTTPLTLGRICSTHGCS